MRIIAFITDRPTIDEHPRSLPGRANSTRGSRPPAARGYRIFPMPGRAASTPSRAPVGIRSTHRLVTRQSTAVRARRELGDQRGIAMSLEDLARVVFALGTNPRMEPRPEAGRRHRLAASTGQAATLRRATRARANRPWATSRRPDVGPVRKASR